MPWCGAVIEGFYIILCNCNVTFWKNMADKKPNEWVSSLLQRFDAQVNCWYETFQCLYFQLLIYRSNIEKGFRPFLQCAIEKSLFTILAISLKECSVISFFMNIWSVHQLYYLWNLCVHRKYLITESERNFYIW